MRARYYDPTTGTFLTRDPLEAITRSPYGYVNGNPLDRRDPTGLDGCSNPAADPYCTDTFVNGGSTNQSGSSITSCDRGRPSFKERNFGTAEGWANFGFAFDMVHPRYGSGGLDDNCRSRVVLAHRTCNDWNRYCQFCWFDN